MIEWLSRLDPQALLAGIALLGVLLALPLEVAALRRLRRLRIASGTFYALLGAFLILLGVAAGLVAVSLHTYRRLTHEQLAAKVSMRQLGEHQFALTLEMPDAEPRRLELRGDQWQIDAQVLKWRGIATVFGFDTAYRLERLSGRYAEIEQERAQPRTVRDLSESEPVDLWALLRRYHAYVPLVDAHYGSGVYVPMVEGAEYLVSVSASGLVVRPDNDSAREALRGWR